MYCGGAVQGFVTYKLDSRVGFAPRGVSYKLCGAVKMADGVRVGSLKLVLNVFGYLGQVMTLIDYQSIRPIFVSWRVWIG